MYNPGERVLSTTTPLFTLLLAGLANFWSDLPRLANLIGAFSLAAGGLFLWDIGRTWRVPIAGWAGLSLYPTFPLVVSTLSSETPLYLAFCLGAIACYARERFNRAAGFAALAVLTRPDGVLLAMLLGADALLRARRPLPPSAVALFAAPLALWSSFAWWYFGSPLPATLFAKQQQGAMAISTDFARGLFPVLHNLAARPHYALEMGLAVPGVYVLRRFPRWTLLPAWALLYFLAYSSLGVSNYFWYYAPLVPGFLALAGLGLSLGQILARAWPAVRETRAWRALPYALIAALALLQGRDAWNLSRNPDRRLPLYKATGEWLRRNVPGHARVGALEVGIIGYYARTPMLDFAGLIQPQVAARLTPATTYDDAALWAVQRDPPAYLALVDQALPRLEERFVRARCRPAKRLPGQTYGYPVDLVIYACTGPG